MPDIDTLHVRLNSLVQAPASISGRERVLIHAGEAGALAAMRLEVSETQLPRQLIFRVDQKKEISFEVASGRVFKVVSPTSHSLFQELEREDLLDAVLETDQNATRLPKLINAFLFGANTLTVETQFLNEPINPLDFGVSANAVFSDCPSETERPNPQESNVLTEFLKACAAYSTAGLVMAGDRATFEFGSNGDLALLRTILLAETSEGAASPLMQMDPGNENQCAIYAGHPTGSRSVLCAAHANNLAMVIFESADLDQILELAKF